MATNKIPVQNEGTLVEAPSKSPAVEYTVKELAAGAAAVFPGISPDCVTAALRLAGVSKATKERSKEIVAKFVAEPVPIPQKKGGR